MALSRLCCNANRLLFPILHNQSCKVQAVRIPRHARNFQRFTEISRPQPKPKPTEAEVVGLTKPFIFTVTFCGAALVAATVCEYKKDKSIIRQRIIDFYQQPRFQDTGLRQYWRQSADWVKVFIPICCMNFAVFCAWHVPRFQPFMKRFFLMTPGSRNIYWQMIFSTFSHVHGFHIAGNMLALGSTMRYAVDFFGPEQFWAFYLCSGVVSNLFSLAYKRAYAVTVPSLGASGAVFGVISYMCLAHPDLRVTIFFFPFMSFSALTLIKANLCLDIVGCVMKWKVLDHAAHIGGVLYGMAWWAYLQDQFTPIRAKLITYLRKRF